MSIKSKIDKLIKNHKFFVNESKPYVGKAKWNELHEYYEYSYSLKDRIYWPVAYVKFMWLSRND